ncbi:hypothetical protein, variant 7 [Aphanomyces astaci]|uniref:DOT1 domain-containing protein n=1 Tax=Aphanomyces astaci TaxID=112090 RepID=W4FFG5_APHAT|nr:hypothetical protein, variant 5 [Aphanomyces astaci]XP_009844241.1 hypothetical protein, variant 6 [Aphanomyces astaci]XP_009844242.1 hypothetical protein, variant 7 [Aphanomyces astaci]ETV66256.1 hypothetical protein, variant 5 [Aphanomyces astaci]ETV66257.1 hypothetical protein, variant 6 [Aphanomyces astaci]ETV66258.1 hypothetical protein, variant 7 [Aphanomyces astaci]|eukprot:XP_009844240.1 hypothetical protein, variant 5 [Aphanomyces astaci]
MPTKHTMWLMQVAASLPVPEKHALKEMVLRGNRRLRSITNVEDVHRVVTIAAVSNAFRAWYTLFDSLAISTDTARYLHQNEHGLHNDDDDDWAASSSASFTYGEVDFFGLASLLAAVRPRPGQTFCDLGHGTGRAVFAAVRLPWTLALSIVARRCCIPSSESWGLSWCHRYSKLPVVRSEPFHVTTTSTAFNSCTATYCMWIGGVAVTSCG